MLPLLRRGFELGPFQIRDGVKWQLTTLWLKLCMLSDCPIKAVHTSMFLQRLPKHSLGGDMAVLHALQISAPLGT